MGSTIPHETFSTKGPHVSIKMLRNIVGKKDGMHQPVETSHLGIELSYRLGRRDPINLPII